MLFFSPTFLLHGNAYWENMRYYSEVTPICNYTIYQHWLKIKFVRNNRYAVSRTSPSVFWVNLTNFYMIRSILPEAFSEGWANYTLSFFTSYIYLFHWCGAIFFFCMLYFFSIKDRLHFKGNPGYAEYTGKPCLHTHTSCLIFFLWPE